MPPDSGPPLTPLFDSLGQSTTDQIFPIEESKRVPIEYRAQVPGRSQRQYIRKPKDAPENWRSAIQQWINEWLENTDSAMPFCSNGLRIVEAQIDWRVISNSGVDEGIIRPVIGAGGWPLLPGSGIKGLFRRACPPERVQRWCGSPCRPDNDLSPGILRFHGAWPADTSWKDGLLDVAHPQQDWQVGFTNGGEKHSAFGVISLYHPRLKIALSCTIPDISTAEWEEIETTLRSALRAGIGGRTCVGYGSSGRFTGDVVFQCGLTGQGPAAKLLDETPEFRPTMFRAAIRGMALRLFGGLTDEASARQAVGRIFGSLSQGEGHNVGLLATAYTDAVINLGSYGSRWEQPIYASSGLLQWRLMRSPDKAESMEILKELLAALHGITMSLAGFGRGWRRPDHRIFNPQYGKTPIGCHWQWRDPEQLPPWIHVQSARDLTRLLQRSRQLASRWLQATGVHLGKPAPWREVIHPERMLIWAREADGQDDAEALNWFHRIPGSVASGDHPDPRELRATDLAGRVDKVGRIWNRMLPLKIQRQSAGSAMPRGAATARPNAAKRPRGDVQINVHSGRFLETLVLFPTTTQHSKAFIEMMDGGTRTDFQRLRWSASTSEP